MKCKHCEKEFIARKNVQKFCESRCRSTYHRLLRKSKAVKKYVTKECKVCGKEFTTPYMNKLTCSKNCNSAVQNLKRKTTQKDIRTCPMCKVEFQPLQKRGVGRTYCSTSCRNRNLYRNRGAGNIIRVSPKTYEEMFKEQGGVCAICGNPETRIPKGSSTTRKMAVDHCHSTGKVRGLLCTGCNQGIGFLKDSVPILNKAIKYLNSA